MKRRLGVAGLAAALLACPAAGDGPHLPKGDEEVVVFPTAAWFDAASGEWVAPLHGWLFEPERDSVKRRALLALLRRSLEIGSDQSPLFNDRARPFLVDNERGKRIGLRLGGHSLLSGETGPEGHFFAEARLGEADVAGMGVGGAGVSPAAMPAGLPEQPAPGGGRWLTVTVETRAGDARRFEGPVQLIPPEGVSVISDVDDTIKVTGMGDRKEVLERTFLKPFEAVPGMAPLYADLGRRGVAFHYVSAMPWQLYEPLRGMLEKEGFPRGTIDLKTFRWKDRRFLDLFAESDRIKQAAISGYLERYPGRKFILIGDDSEADPALYARLARAHRGSLAGVAIRRSGIEGRVAAPAEPIPGVPWLVFTEPGELRQWPPIAAILTGERQERR